MYKQGFGDFKYYVGISSLEWYSLDHGMMRYSHMHTFMRDAGDQLQFEGPIQIKVSWDELLP